MASFRREFLFRVAGPDFDLDEEEVPELGPKVDGVPMPRIDRYALFELYVLEQIR